jgi:pyridoxal kinase
LANDLSGIGKVALTPAIPIMACCQIETILLPTILLSSHTGGFQQIAIQELLDFTKQSLEQWKALSLKTDALFIGYCRQIEQLKLLLDYHTTQNTDALLIVDPIMGDHGKLYSGFTEEYVQQMRTVCSKADVILPNLTEAALLTKTEYLEGVQPVEAYQELAKKLADLGAKKVILTGIQTEVGSIGLLSYDNATEQFATAFTPHYPHHFFGTGDIVSAILSACILQGYSLEKALSIATTFLDATLQETIAQQKNLQYGVAFEPQLHLLTQLFHS